jgi:uncharacterized protein (TIGR03084 family)
MGSGRECRVSTDIFDDLEAEQDQLERVLFELPDQDWRCAAGAASWTITDVVLHLAQTEEAVVATATEGTALPDWRRYGTDVDDAMDAMVRAERDALVDTFGRWRIARRAALAALRRADPQQSLAWVRSSLKPRTLATTRLAEHWAHALDITVPLGIDYPDTVRLRHVAWLGHHTLPYAFALAGLEPRPVYCELTAPDAATWRFGPPQADSSITGAAGAFCRVGARRLAPEESGLVAEGPHGSAALRVLRNYAA